MGGTEGLRKLRHGTEGIAGLGDTEGAVGLDGWVVAHGWVAAEGQGRVCLSFLGGRPEVGRELLEGRRSLRPLFFEGGGLSLYS